MKNSLVEGEDFYCEGAVIVFTAGFHLRRGYCCESGCRHCPYRETVTILAATKRENSCEAVFEVHHVE